MSFRLQITGINSKSSQSNPGIDIEEPNPIRALIASHADLSASHYDLSANHSALKSTVTDLSASHYDLSANHRALKSTVSDLSASHYDLSANHRALKSTVSDLSASHYDLSRNHLTLKNTVSDLSASHYDLSANHLTLKNTVTDLSASHYDLSANHRALKTLVTDLSASHYDLSANHRALKTLVTDLSTNNNIRFNNIDTSLSQVYTKTQSDSIFVSKSNIDLSNLSTNIIPSTDNTYKIGDISKNWRNAYIKDISATNIDIANNLNVLGPTQLKNTLNVADDVTLNGSTLYAPSTFTIDPYGHGDNTGTLFINGNLTVQGLTTTINSSVVDISDKKILLASNAANSIEATGAGFEISGANVNFIYDYPSSAFRSSIGLSISGNVVPATGTIVNLGQSDNRWKIAYIDELNVNSFTYSINGANITSETITSTQIMNNTIMDSDISTNAAIQGSKIASETITSTQIMSGTILGTDISNDTITSANIRDGSILTADICDNAITFDKLAYNSVGNTRIINLAVTHEKLSSNCVQSHNIVDGTIVDGDISANANILGTKLANNSITSDKIDQSNNWTFSQLTSNTAYIRDISAYNISVSGNIIPLDNSSSDLGSLTKRWRNIYVNDLSVSTINGQAYNAAPDLTSVSGNIIPSINNTFRLGDTSRNWSNAYIKDISASNISVSGNILPLDNSSSDLGSLTKRWRNIFVNDLSVSTINGQAYSATTAIDLTSVSGNIIPASNNTFRLGDTSRNWSNAYIRDISATNISISGNIMFSISGGSMRIAVNESNNSITSTHRIYQNISGDPSWSSVNGYYGLTKDAYPVLNPLSSGLKAIQTWTPRATGIKKMRSICWSPQLGIFVVVIWEGANPVMTSPDGITWTTQTSPTNQWLDVCWSPELKLFVAVSDAGANQVTTSSNGTTWSTNGVASESSSWISVCWSRELGLFVAVSYLGKVMSSPDGINWTSRTAESKQWHSVCWAAELGLFVAVAPFSNIVIISNNGITWTSVSISTVSNAAGKQWRSICWSPQLGLFVSTSSSSNGTVMTSSNGINWTERYTESTNWMAGVCWSPELGLFVASGATLSTSSNGINWTAITVSEQNTWRDVCWSPELGIFVAIAEGGTSNRVMTSSLKARPPTSYNVFDSSFNSIDQSGNWTFSAIDISTNLNPSLPNSGSLGLSNKRWANAFVNDLSVSTINGQAYSAGGGGTAIDLTSVSGNIIPSLNNTFRLGDVSRNWSNAYIRDISATNISISGNIIFSISGGSMRIAADASTSSITSTHRIYQNISGSINDLSWSSVNGYYALAKDAYPGLNPLSSGDLAVKTLTTRDIGTNGRAVWGAICWSPELGIFVVGSITGIGIMTSSDGVNWTTRSVANGESRSSIVWSSLLKIFVAVFWNGYASTSTDGINWIQRDQFSNAVWYSVCWAPEIGLFVAVGLVGTNNRVMTSTNGLNWTRGTNIPQSDWYSVVWSPELRIFVAMSVGGINYAMTSRNGINWTMQTNALFNYEWRSICWSPQLGIFVAIGQNRSLISNNGIDWNIYLSSSGVFDQSICWSPELKLFFATSLGGSIATSNNGIIWTARVSTGEGYRCSCWSPELGIFVSPSTRGYVLTSSLKGRPPTSYNVFDSSFNSIDQSGNWTFQNITTKSRIYQNISGGINDLSWAAVNGYYGLAKDAYPALNPLSSGAKALQTWTNRNITGRWNSICWSPKLGLFLAINTTTYGSLLQSNYITSKDGINWSVGSFVARTFAGTTNPGIASICWSPELEIFVGYSTTDTSSVIYSTNGTSWNYSNINISIAVDIYTLCWSPELRIFLAAHKVPSLGIFSSKDGITWNSVNPSFTPSMSSQIITRSICWSSELGLFVGVGSYGTWRVITSNNGTNWNLIDIGTANSFYSVCWSKELGLFVAVGNSNTFRVAISNNGREWTLVNIGTTYALFTVTWAPQLGLFVAGSNNNTILTSSYGIKWNVNNSSGDFLSSCWSPELGIHVAVGNDTIVTSSLKARPPTSTNVFDSSFNSIDENGNWTFSAIDISTNLNPSLPNSGSLGLSNKRWANAFVNDLSVTTINGQAYSAGGTAIDLTSVSGNIIPASNVNFRLGDTSRNWSNAYIRDISATNISISGNFILNIGGTMSDITDTFNNLSNTFDAITTSISDIDFKVIDLSNNKANIANPTFTGLISVSGNILPLNPLSGNLGTSSNPWGNAVIRDLSIGSIDVSINVYPSFPNSGSLGLSNKRWANAFINDLSVSTINGQAYSAGGGGTAIDLTSVSGNIIPSSDIQFKLGDTSRNWSNAYIRDISATNISVSGNIIFSISGGSMRIAADATTNRITTTHSIYQEINSQTSWSAVNGYYALAKDAYPGLNPLSSGIKAVSTWIPRTQGIPLLRWRALCWAAEYDTGLFLTIGYDEGGNNILTSVDGVNWVSRQAIAGPWRAVCWSPHFKRFVAVGYGASMYSNDLITWYSGVWSPNNLYSDWESVCWSPELRMFVAVAYVSANEINNVMYSYDGINWIRITVPNTRWKGVCWSPQLKIFVAIGEGGGVGSIRVMSSNNGINWRMVSSAYGHASRSICWSPQLGLFVAVSDNGRPIYSYNGETWELSTSGLVYGSNSVCWSPELEIFVAIARDGSNRLMYSHNGMDWTQLALPGNTQWWNICWSPQQGLFVATATTGTNRVITSSLKGRPPTLHNVFDSSFNSIDQSGNWTFQNIDISTNLNPSSSLTGNLGTASKIWGNAVIRDLSVTRINGFVYSAATAIDLTSVSGNIIPSSDIQFKLGDVSRNWSNAYIKDISATNISVSGNIIFSVSGGSMRIAADTSTNSITSTHRIYQNISGGINDPSWSLVNGYYALAKDSYPGLNPLSSGVKAVQTWTSRELPTSTVWRSVCWSPERGMFVAVGVNNVVYSFDGLIWSNQTTGVVSSGWFSVCWSPQLTRFVAVASSGTNKVMYSSNGINWTSVLLSNSVSWSDVCWSPQLGLFVAVGTTTTNRVMYSYDGSSNWTQPAVEVPLGGGSIAICWSPELKLFVVVSDGGLGVFISSNGINWTTTLDYPGYYYAGVCWSPQLGLFVAVSYFGQVMISSNGINWSEVSVPYANWINVSWCADIGLFIAVADSGVNRLMYSPNGINWTSVFIQQFSWESVCWSPELGLAVIVGRNGGGAINTVLTSSLKGRPPTSTNVFDNSFNAIDENGNWTLKQLTLSDLSSTNITTLINSLLTRVSQLEAML